MTDPDRCPILESIIAQGGEVHLPEGRSPASSTIARLAGAAGLTAALAFVPVANAAPLNGQFHPIASSPMPGVPLMAFATVPGVMDGPAAEVRSDYKDWSLRGTITDDRVEFASGRSSIKVRRDLAQIIVDAASDTGAEPDVMMAMADKESSFDPKARTPTSSAAGLYQFLSATWLETVKRHGAKHGMKAEADSIVVQKGDYVVPDAAERTRILDLRLNPRMAALMACENYLAQKAELGGRIGSHPTATESYMAHMLGSNGASRFIQAKRAKPGAVAKRLFPAAAGSNKSIFHEGHRPRTMGEVHQVISNQIDSRLSLYTGIADKLDPFSPAFKR